MTETPPVDAVVPLNDTAEMVHLTEDVPQKVKNCIEKCTSFKKNVAKSGLESLHRGSWEWMAVLPAFL